MTYVVTENCIKCKYLDCVEVCPVNCFYEGENMVVINPDQCIDCGVCEVECPIQAIMPDTREGAESWVEVNRQYAALWPNVTHAGVAAPDAKEWENVPNKFKNHFSPKAAAKRES